MPSTSFSHHKPCRATTSPSSNSSSPVFSSAAACSVSSPKQDSGGSGGSCEQSPRRLTRQRKLRHINNQDFYLPEKSYSSPASPDYSTQKSRSPGRGSKSNHWSSAPAPQPLPLPESPVIRKPESAKNGFFGPSTRKVKGKAVTCSGSALPSSYSSQVATTSGESAAAVSFYSNNRRGALSQDANNGGGSLSSCSSQVATTSGGSSAPVSSYSNNRRGALSQDANNGGGFFINLGLNILSRKAPAKGISSHPFSPQRSKTVDSYPLLVAPTSPVNCSGNCHRGTPHEYESCNMSRSAPTSAFSSPAVSPRRSNTAGDFFYSFGAPHDQNLDVFPPRLSPNRPAHSPTHSPTSRSPCFNQKSSNGNPFLLPSLERAESSGQVSAHPLPLPPPPQQSVMHHNAEALSLSSMKGQWQKGKLIGRGTFGSVYLATNRETGALCAMKEVDLIPDDPKAAECIKQLEQEIKVLRTLKHPNIVQYYGSEMTEDHFYIYLEYVHPGSINKYVQDHIGTMTESVVRNFTRHILSGLAFLHSTKTIHRDIKGANLLVDASGVVKLADFGMAKHLNGQSYNLSLKGSPYWMAPEVIRAAMQNSAAPDLALAVDIWSLGCTIVEMFNGRPPWSEFTGPQAMFKVLNTIPDIPETLSAEGKDFLHLCFRRNPAERPLASKLLEHPFVRNSYVRPFQ